MYKKIMMVNDDDDDYDGIYADYSYIFNDMDFFFNLENKKLIGSET